MSTLHEDMVSLGILWLARRFLDEAAPDKRFSSEAEQALLAHDWPGNARELKHAVERGAILSEDATVWPSVLFRGRGQREPSACSEPGGLHCLGRVSARRWLTTTAIRGVPQEHWASAERTCGRK